jgi:hypothetical protein
MGGCYMRLKIMHLLICLDIHFHVYRAAQEIPGIG